MSMPPKYANIPAGSGHKLVDRRGKADATATTPPGAPGKRGRRYRPRIGTAFVHTAIDDHTRLAYAETCADESTATTIAALQRTVAWFAEHGVAVKRFLTNNGSAYKSHA